MTVLCMKLSLSLQFITGPVMDSEEYFDRRGCKGTLVNSFAIIIIIILLLLYNYLQPPPAPQWMSLKTPFDSTLTFVPQPLLVTCIHSVTWFIFIIP